MNVPMVPMAGLDSEALCLAIRQSRRMLLHAAIYNNFANEPFASAFVIALARPDFIQLTLISHHSHHHWQDEFGQILRQGWSHSALSEAYQHSDQWIETLKTRSNKVHLYRSVSLPLAPILLIDDQIWVGHYAHSSEPAGSGLWLQLNCQEFGVSVQTLWHWAQQHALPEQATAWQRALYRYVSECHHAQSLAARE